MDPLALVILGLAPALFGLLLFAGANRHRPDPLALVLRTFLLGLLAALPIVLVEALIIRSDAPRGPYAYDHLVFLLPVVIPAFLEELAKFLVVRVSLGDSPYLDEPLRGLVYASASALGFAALENLDALRSHGLDALTPALFLDTFGHVATAALWGYGLGADRLARAESRPVRGFAILGLVAALALHATYESAALQSRDDIAFAAFLGATILCILLFVRANRTSIHRGRRGALQVRCPACAALSPLGKRFCAACGGSLPRRADPLCGACQHPVARSAAFCTHCGAKQDLAE